MFDGVMTFQVLEVMQGEGFEIFNFFFTIMCVFGLMSFTITMLVKIVTRS